MGWICKVCSKPATMVADFPSSHANKKGDYTVMRYGYCKKHPPRIMTMKEYKKNSKEQMKERLKPMTVKLFRGERRKAEIKQFADIHTLREYFFAHSDEYTRWEQIR